MNSIEHAKYVRLSNGLGFGLWYRFYSVDHVHSNSFRLRKSFSVRALRFVKIWHKTDQENHFSYLKPFNLVHSNSLSNFIMNNVWLLKFDNFNLKVLHSVVRNFRTLFGPHRQVRIVRTALFVMIFTRLIYLQWICRFWAVSVENCAYKNRYGEHNRRKFQENIYNLRLNGVKFTRWRYTIWHKAYS